jgi:hypothetical protein
MVAGRRKLPRLLGYHTGKRGEPAKRVSHPNNGVWPVAAALSPPPPYPSALRTILLDIAYTTHLSIPPQVTPTRCNGSAHCCSHASLEASGSLVSGSSASAERRQLATQSPHTRPAERAHIPLGLRCKHAEPHEPLQPRINAGVRHVTQVRSGRDTVHDVEG